MPQNTLICVDYFLQYENNSLQIVNKNGELVRELNKYYSFEKINPNRDKKIIKYKVIFSESGFEDFNKKELVSVLEDVTNFMLDEYMLNFKVRYCIVHPCLQKMYKQALQFVWNGNSNYANNKTTVALSGSKGFHKLIKEILWSLGIEAYKENDMNIMSESVKDIMFSLDQNLLLNDLKINCQEFSQKTENILPRNYQPVMIDEGDKFDIIPKILDLDEEEFYNFLIKNPHEINNINMDLQSSDLEVYKSKIQLSKDNQFEFMTKRVNEKFNNLDQNKQKSKGDILTKLKPNVDLLIKEKIDFLGNTEKYKNLPAKPKKVSNAWVKILQNILRQFKLFVILPFLFVSCTPQTVDISTEIKEVSHLYDIGESKKAIELLEGLEPILLKKKYR